MSEGNWMKSIPKRMKTRDAKSIKVRFLAEIKRHIEQLFQIVNYAPIPSRKLWSNNISIYILMEQISYETGFPTRSYHGFSNQRSKQNHCSAEFIGSGSTDNRIGIWIPNLSLYVSKERFTSLVSNEVSFVQIRIFNRNL